MPRRPSVRYWPSRNGYCCKLKGQQHLLASGPDDYPEGPTFKAACRAFWELTECSLEPAGDNKLVRAVLDAYLVAAELRLAPGSFRLRLADCKLFASRWGELRCNQLTPYHVTTIVDEMRQPRAKGKRVFKWEAARAIMFITSVKAGFNWAVEQGLLLANPLRGVKVPRAATRSRGRVLTPDEHQQVLAGLAKPRHLALRNLVVALEATGARPGELCNATLADWHDDIGALVYYRDTARQQDEFRHKTGAIKDRVIYFTGEALALVRELVKDKAPAALVFPNKWGERWEESTLIAAFKALRKRVGLPHLIPYVYRHTFATAWLKRGESVEVLANLLGNTPATIMHHYAHLIHEHSAMRAHLERVRGT